MSTPASGSPNFSSFSQTCNGRCSLPSRQRAAQFVGRHGDRREGAGGLGLEEAEILGQFGRNEIAKGNVVHQHHELDVRSGVGSRRRIGHVVGDDRDFGLEIDAPGLVGGDDNVGRTDKGIRAALVHQGIGPERWRHLRAARFADQLDMGDIGRAVGPLIGAGQGRQAILRVEGMRRRPRYPCSRGHRPLRVRVRSRSSHRVPIAASARSPGTGTQVLQIAR